jgi:hypothetical protein
MRTSAAMVGLLTCLIGTSVFAADPIPQVDAKISTQGKFWQGQRVVLTVSVKTPDLFASAVAFDLPQVAGLIIVPPTGSPTLGAESIGDDSYTTQTHDLNLFPQRSGDVTIPSFMIRFDSNAGFGKPTQARSVTTPPVSFTANQPPGTEHLSIVLTTTQLSVTESWQPEPAEKSVKVGDAFTRTVRIQADNLAGIVLPSFQYKELDGLRLYEQAPALNDQTNRGDLTGKRDETTTVFCEKSGTFELPAMTVNWWNPNDQTLHDITLPAHTIIVTAAAISSESDDVTQSPEVKPSATNQLRRLFETFILWMTSYLIWRLIKPRCLAALAEYANSERRAFANVVAACRKGDANATYRAILAWRVKIEMDFNRNPGEKTVNFEDDPQLSAEMNHLDSTIYGDSTGSHADIWSPEKLIERLTAFRAGVKHKQSGRTKMDLPD